VRANRALRETAVDAVVGAGAAEIERREQSHTVAEVFGDGCRCDRTGGIHGVGPGQGQERFDFTAERSRSRINPAQFAALGLERVLEPPQLELPRGLPCKCVRGLGHDLGFVLGQRVEVDAGDARHSASTGRAKCVRGVDGDTPFRVPGGCATFRGRTARTPMGQRDGPDVPVSPVDPTDAFLPDLLDVAHEVPRRSG